jgi:hypothetical protein
MLCHRQSSTDHGLIVPHGRHNLQQVHRNVQHRRHKSHHRAKAIFGVYQAIFFWAALIGLAVLAQHVYEQYAQSVPDEGPVLSVSPYGDVRVWREKVDDLSLAATKWLQEAHDQVEHHRRTTILLVKLEEANEALLILRADVRSDNYPVWAAKLKQLWKLMPLKPVPGSRVATDIEMLINKLVNGMFWLKREALYT